MKISVLSLFPEYFDPLLNTSIIKRAKEQRKSLGGCDHSPGQCPSAQRRPDGRACRPQGGT